MYTYLFRTANMLYKCMQCYIYFMCIFSDVIKHFNYNCISHLLLKNFYHLILRECYREKTEKVLTRGRL